MPGVGEFRGGETAIPVGAQIRNNLRSLRYLLFNSSSKLMLGPKNLYLLILGCKKGNLQAICDSTRTPSLDQEWVNNCASV
jgi:hypothetical protein